MSHRLLRPKYSILGRLRNTNIFLDKNAFDGCAEIEKVRIFRYTSALCYLNKTYLRSGLKRACPTIFEPNNRPAKLIGQCVSMLSNPKLSRLFGSRDNRSSGDSSSDSGDSNGNNIEFLIIDCSGITYCDMSGATALVELIDELNEETNFRGRVQVYLVSCSCSLVQMVGTNLHRSELLSTNVFPTILDAIGYIDNRKSPAN